MAAILDLTIPGGRGGKETVHALLEIDPDIKVVASSGYSEDPVMFKPSDYGFAGRLVKPYRLSDLILLLETLEATGIMEQFGWRHNYAPLFS